MHPIQFIQDKIELFKIRVHRANDIVMDRIYRASFFWMLMIALVWLAIFLYILFYYYYVPAPSYVRPVHLQLKPCDENKSFEKCPFPSAHVKLTKRHHILAVGQLYRFSVTLDMPESPANKKLGMFMVCLQLKDTNGYLASHTCRSNMLRYYSDMLQALTLLLLSPLYMFGTKEEKQQIYFELYSDYMEDQLHQVTDVYVEVQSREAEIYSATLVIEARLRGLRYMMYNWPITSAIIGISLNTCIFLFVTALSLYQRYSSRSERTFGQVSKVINGFNGLRKRGSRVKANDDRSSMGSDDNKENVNPHKPGPSKVDDDLKYELKKNDLNYMVE